MRLNIGSGPHYAEGWFNIDLYATDADVRGDTFALPFPEDTFDQVYAGHVLEHLPYESLPTMIAEVRRVLAPGGRFAVVGPCIEAAVHTRQPQWLLEDIVRSTDLDRPGEGHWWTPTGYFTLAAVRQVFPDAETVPVSSLCKPAWPNPVLDDWQCAMVAVA